MKIPALPGEPFDLVLDVGGNVGSFAAQAAARWPDARVVSFEPIPSVAMLNEQRAADPYDDDRPFWGVERVAISDTDFGATLYVCENQHTASTMQEPGGTRRREFGIVDNFAPIHVPTRRLDTYLPLCDQRFRILVKIDVEGHEGKVIAGAGDVLALASTVICECQQDADIFVDAPSPQDVDEMLQRHGLAFAGIADALTGRDRRVVQFDGIWTRDR